MITISDVKKLREETLAPILECQKALQEANGDFNKAKEILKKQDLIKAEKKSASQTKAGLIEAYLSEDRRKGILIDLRSETDFVARHPEFTALAQRIITILLTQDIINDGQASDLETIFSFKDLKSGETIDTIIKLAIAKFGENIELKQIGILLKKPEENGIIEYYLHSNKRVGVLVDLKCQKKETEANPDFKNFAHDLAMQIAAMDPTYLKPEDIPEDEIKKLQDIYREQVQDANKPAAVIEKIIMGKMEKEFQVLCLFNQTFIKNESETIAQFIKNTNTKLGEEIEIKRFLRFEIV